MPRRSCVEQEMAERRRRETECDDDAQETAGQRKPFGNPADAKSGAIRRAATDAIPEVKPEAAKNRRIKYKCQHAA